MPFKWFNEKAMRFRTLLTSVASGGELIAITLITFLAAVSFSYLLKTDRVYTHFFYIPLAICAAKYPKYSVKFGVFFASMHILIEWILRHNIDVTVLLRASIIIIVATLLERIWVKERNYLNVIHSLDYESAHDALTGVLNRRGLEQMIKENRLNYPVTLIMCDLNGLKRINDFYGHELGDTYIIEAAKIMQAAMRNGDLAIRLGGDEFLMVLQGCLIEQSKQVVHRLEMGQVNFNASTLGLARPELAIAYGVSECQCQEQWHMAVSESDEKMYEHKDCYKQKGGCY